MQGLPAREWTILMNILKLYLNTDSPYILRRDICNFLKSVQFMKFCARKMLQEHWPKVSSQRSVSDCCKSPQTPSLPPTHHHHQGPPLSPQTSPCLYSPMCRTVWEMKVMVDGMGVMLHHTEVTAACSTFSFYWMKLFENVSKSKLSTFGWRDNVKCKDVSVQCFVALIPASTKTHGLADGILPLI